MKTRQGSEECGGSGEAAGFDGISFNSRKREMAVPDTKAGECD